MQKIVARFVVVALLAQTSGGAFAAAPAPTALPTGGQVVAGSAGITQTGSQMTINQTTDKAILNWNSFNIGANAGVTFVQPSSSSVALNRVLSSDPSSIYGSLRANGQVFLVNPNGVLFGQGARVDVGGLVASTMAISDADFLNGDYRFSRNGAIGSVLNQGDIAAKYVALLAPEVRNEGVIAASMGTVVLAAGENVTLGITGQQLLDVQVTKAQIDTLVENKHLIQVDGGTAILSAQSANGLLGSVVNTGQVMADGITADGGTIRITASSNIHNSGTLSANAGANGKGGNIIAIADLDNPNSRMVVDGTLSARGGSLSGDGGFIETSGTHLKVEDSVSISTLAAFGRAGQWLLDPFDFTIAAAGGDITGATLTAALAGGDVTIQTLLGSVTCAGTVCGAGNAAGNGDIFVNDAVTIGNARTLTLNAYRNIVFNSSIDATVANRLYLWYGMKGNGEPGAIIVNSGGSATGTGGTPNNIRGGNFAVEAAHTYPSIANLVYTPTTTTTTTTTAINKTVASTQSTPPACSGIGQSRIACAFDHGDFLINWVAGAYRNALLGTAALPGFQPTLEQWFAVYLDLYKWLSSMLNSKCPTCTPLTADELNTWIFTGK